MLISPKAGNFAVFAGQPGYNLLKQRTFIFHDKGRTIYGRGFGKILAPKGSNNITT